MADRKQVLDEVRASFHSEPRFGPHRHVDVDFEDGTLILEGEVADVAVKKLLLERGAAHPEVDGIVDRLRVKAAQRMGDGEMRRRLCAVLLQEPALAEIAVRVREDGDLVTMREPPHRCRGEVWVTVDDGIVTLDGSVPGLAHKRLAGVLAWWVPGSRDVINGIQTPSDEPDRDDDITDAVRIALEKDPFVNASQIRVTTRDGVVRLQGAVPKDAEREMAEFDAWYVFAVDRVANELKVQAIPATGRA
jgi:osmotically-inducible protein OsmY